MLRLLLVLALGFSTTTDTHAQASAVHDSAGIRIVDNPSRSAAPIQWQLGRPAAVIGGNDKPLDAQLFTSKSEYGVLAFARLRDGRILVADGWQEADGGGGPPATKTWLKYFGPAGALLSVVKLDDATPTNVPFKVTIYLAHQCPTCFSLSSRLGTVIGDVTSKIIA